MSNDSSYFMPIKTANKRFQITIITLLASLLAFGSLLFPSLTSAATKYTALEIFASEGSLVVPPTNFVGSPVANTAAVYSDLPVGTIAEFVVMGVVTAVNAEQTEWRIGTQPIYVYTHDETRFDNAPALGSEVKVVATRSLAGGPIIADRITNKTPSGVTPAAAVVEIDYLVNGVVSAKTAEHWVVGGIQYIINDSEFPAEIDPGLDIGETITVQFLAEDDGVVNGTPQNTALEIFASEGPILIYKALHPLPRINYMPIPTEGIPTTAKAQLVIFGKVTALNAEKTRIKVGSGDTYVYPSRFTRTDGTLRLGSYVKIVAKRKLTPGVIIADRITIKPTPATVPSSPVIEVAYLYRGNVEAMTTTRWTIGGYEFAIDNPEFPAEIDPGIDFIGSDVTVEFDRL